MDLSSAQLQTLSDKIVANLEAVIVGKRAALELVVVGLLCQGHVLIEDVPGVGKTMLARSLAQSVGGAFSRIQFTPDLLPGDVTGTSIYNQMTQQFEFRPGPLVGNIVLADEINRATPKTQSALLEAMEERQITADGALHPLPRPFMVVATQNPIEYEGTFPLPEAQLDRFLLRVSLGYPARKDELRLVAEQQLRHPIESIGCVVSLDELGAMQESVKKVYVSDAVEEYLVDLARATREDENVYLGASPRGSLGLYRAGQAQAAMHGRDFVLPDDVKALAVPVLAHRLILSPAARVNNRSAGEIVGDIVARVALPDRSGARRLT